MNENKLIVYFSWSGNSKKIANALLEKIKADVFEIKTIKEYPKTYLACVTQAGTERLKKERPKLEKYLEGIESYKEIILIFPNWWNNLPMSVVHFLETYHFFDKTIFPICTHGGGGLGKSIEHIREICPKAKIEAGVSIHKKEISTGLHEKLKNILEKIK